MRCHVTRCAPKAESSSQCLQFPLQALNFLVLSLLFLLLSLERLRNHHTSTFETPGTTRTSETTVHSAHQNLWNQCPETSGTPRVSTGCRIEPLSGLRPVSQGCWGKLLVEGKTAPQFQTHLNILNIYSSESSD